MEDIIYKKNALGELGDYLSEQYFEKNILIITTRKLVGIYLTEIMNSVCQSKSSFKSFVAKNGFSTEEMGQISEMLTCEDFDLILVFGSNRATNVAKYYSSIFSLPLIVCPSACSTLSYFNNICINPYDETRSFICDYPRKIFVSEMVIKKCPLNLVKQGIYLIASLEEVIASLNIENILCDKNIDTSYLKEILEKFYKELKGITSGDDEEKLILFDLLIKVANGLNTNDIMKSELFNLYLVLSKVLRCEHEVIYSGEKLFISSNLILSAYRQMFAQKKIFRLTYPNYVDYASIIKKYGIYYKALNNSSFFDRVVQNHDLIVRLNNLKEEFCFQCEKKLENQKIVIENIKNNTSIFSCNSPKIDFVLTSLKVVPFVFECSMAMSIMGATGLCDAL